MQSSALCQKFENNSFGDAWLLGDGGCPLKKWLVTPLSNPVSSSEQKYNIAHQKTHSIVERAFGILKERWRILDLTSGPLCYAPQRVLKIVVTCCVLHNICRRNGLVFSNDFDSVNERFSANEEVDCDLQQPSGWEIAQKQRLVSLIGSSTNYDIADYISQMIY